MTVRCTSQQFVTVVMITHCPRYYSRLGLSATKSTNSENPAINVLQYGGCGFAATNRIPLNFRLAHGK